MGRLINMAGWKMWQHGIPQSRLEVLYRAPQNTIDNKPQWVCKCQCGTIITVYSKRLRNGNTKSCGCLQRDKIKALGKSHRANLVGERYGFLTVINDTGKQASGGHTIWQCKCDCGNICQVTTSNLKTTRSCGCKKFSIGEQNIKKFLTAHNYNFLFDSTFFKDLRSQYNRILRYDFILLDNYNQPYWLIEFDGVQHNKECKSQYFSSNLQQIKQRDQLKNNYAIQHNIPLVRIPYKQKNNITEEILFSEKYLLSNFKMIL